LALGVPVLADAPELKGIVRLYLEHQLMPQDDAGDALHLAIASFHAVDYLMTWNCRHLANANKFEHICRINLRLGLLTPLIVTPAQLFEEC
jgi:predicted nucleic acid-binding protein